MSKMLIYFVLDAPTQTRHNLTVEWKRSHESLRACMPPPPTPTTTPTPTPTHTLTPFRSLPNTNPRHLYNQYVHTSARHYLHVYLLLPIDCFLSLIIFSFRTSHTHRYHEAIFRSHSWSRWTETTKNWVQRWNTFAHICLKIFRQSGNNSSKKDRWESGKLSPPTNSLIWHPD